MTEINQGLMFYQWGKDLHAAGAVAGALALARATALAATRARLLLLGHTALLGVLALAATQGLATGALACLRTALYER